MYGTFQCAIHSVRCSMNGLKERKMKMYNNIKTEREYNLLLKSGMFWVAYPELCGIWDKDKLLINTSERKKYSIIYIDPPWKYNKRTNNNRQNKSWFGGGATSQYNTMSINEIAKLPLNNLADKNCALFLWTTFPYLDKQIKLIEGWGFEYKTLGFSWIKTNKKQTKKPYFGVGYYTKSNCEVCLLAVKGKMKPVSNKVSSVVISPISKHSEKPNEVRDKIVELFGDLPRLEMFARKETNGWDVFGNEVENSIDLSEYYT